jgi:hypothetical protein
MHSGGRGKMEQQPQLLFEHLTATVALQTGQVVGRGRAGSGPRGPLDRSDQNESAGPPDLSYFSRNALSHEMAKRESAFLPGYFKSSGGVDHRAMAIRQ